MKTLLETFYYRLYKTLSKLNLIKHFDNCEKLPLVIFCKIANGASYKLLVKKGFYNRRYCAEIWSDILTEYSKLDNKSGIEDGLKTTKKISSLTNSYITIKAMIRYLWYVSPFNEKNGEYALNIIEDLQKMGYKISLNSSKEYKESLIKADKKCNYLITYITINKKALKEKNQETTVINFDEIISYLSLEFNINENISVSRYLAMRTIIENKSKNDNRGRKD